MLESLNPAYDVKQDTYEQLCISKELMLEKCFTNKMVQQPDEETKKPWETSKKLPDSIYHEVEEAHFEDLLAGIKRRLFFDTLKSIYTFNKHPWAKLTVQ